MPSHYEALSNQDFVNKLIEVYKQLNPVSSLGRQIAQDTVIYRVTKMG